MTGDLAGRVLSGEPSHAELVRIADGAGDVLLAELTERMVDDAGEPPDRVVLARNAAAVERFVALLAPRRRDPLAAEASLWLASLALDDGRFEEVTRRTEAIIARLDPGNGGAGSLGLAEALLGVVAREQGRTADALAHWNRARDLALADDDPSTAARAAGSAASLLQSDPDIPAAVMRERWTTAFELYTRAGQTDDARITGVNASVHAIRVFEATEPGTWDPHRMLDEIHSARAFALRAGADHEAAHLVYLIVGTLSDLGAPMDAIRSWTATARAAYRALVPVPPDLPVWLAKIDFAEGNSAMIAGDPVSAEAPLRSALAGFESAGETDRAADVRRQLLSVVHAGDRDGDERAAALLREMPGDSSDGAAMTAYMAEVAARTTASATELDRLHRRTRELLLAAGEPLKAAAIDIEHAVAGLRHGSPVPLRAALAAARVLLADPGPGAPHAALRWLSILAVTGRAALAGHVGDRAGQIAALRALEDEQLTAGAGLLAARAAIHRAGLLLEAGRADEAYTVALPAALALDAVRFTLSDAGRRRRWGGLAAEGFGIACRAGARLGNVRELAELVEVMRGASLPDPTRQPPDSLDRLLAQAGRDLMRSGPNGDRPPPATGRTALSGAAALAGEPAPDDPGRTALGLPARLRTPWGSRALAEHLDRALTYLDPVRSDAVVDWSVPGFTAGPAGAPAGRPPTA